jgi:ATP-dependent 26S proteasome regulatory subunit
MEDYDAPGLLVATTNVESSLDPALFRRFDDVFFVPPPGPEEINKLLRLTLSAVRMAEMINWERVCDELSGASAAMVVKAAQDAAKAAVLGETKGVTETLLLQAVAEIRKGDRIAQEG